jgi:DNA-binding CsgD family transcriptional regulator
MGVLQTLEYEDQEIVYQVLAVAIPRLTEMQTRCLLLTFIGLSQERMAAVLGIRRQSVSDHVAKALAVIAAAAGEL